MVNFVLNYYFKDNEYFNARKQYIIQNRNSVNVTDIKKIFNKIIEQLENRFSDSEISFYDRGTFHKIPIDQWRITEFREEYSKIGTETGFLKHEIGKLRKKVDLHKDFQQEDLVYVADLLNELSFLLKN